MTSEVNCFKTNEFEQRRKLRLQQVREQSKEIAKKIRQRAKVETLQQKKVVDAKKEKKYLECQKQFVNRLQELYTKGLQNVGAGHENASEYNVEDFDKKIDKSKVRGREAVAALRRKKQEILNKNKQLLDRKLRAREAANELSREKSTVVSKNLQTTTKDSEVVSDNKKIDDIQNSKQSADPVKKIDMATQSNLDEPSNDCQTEVPILLLPENECIRESDIAEKSENSKRPNLFALSDEMPSSLRGGISSSKSQEDVCQKSSLTLVSEYIQNRHLRLRESETKCHKNQTEDLQNIKHTILQARASKTEVQGSNKGYSTKTSTVDSGHERKGVVMMYNHSTRDVRNLPYSNENLVVRDQNTDEDAYSKAQKEETNDNLKQKEVQAKIEMQRNKVAVTKENVDKEYRDTLAFLNSLPNNMSSKPIRKAYMDEKRQQQLQDTHQQKLQQEFRNIEKECRKHKCKHAKNVQSKLKTQNKEHDDLNKKDFQYSWMPVPETENNLGVHTIPVRGKRGSTVQFSEYEDYHEYRSSHKHTPPTKDNPINGKSPKNRYVETVLIEQSGNESTDCSSITSDSSSVDNLDLNRRKKKVESSEEFDSKLSDADRVVIYKILNSKYDKKRKLHKKSNLVQKSSKLTESTGEEVSNKCNDNEDITKTKKNLIADKNDNIINTTPFEQLTEGIYKAVTDNGDNMTSLQFCENTKTIKNLTSKEETDKVHRCCHCAKENTKGDYTDPSQNRCESSKSSAGKCDCGGNMQNPEVPLIQPSVATSTSSFKIAANNKNNVLLSDNGHIKFIDEGGQENGKFYVGATGFLKDETYEVIIQLRKKELNGKDEANSKKQATIPETTINKQLSTNDHIQLQHSTSPMKERNDLNKDPEQENTEEQIEGRNPLSGPVPPTLLSKSTDNQVASNINLQTSTATSNQAEPTKINNESEKNSNHAQKATSTYTQTTNSPIHRPIFMHMSSSTSTAYMSPPELILPSFLKRDYALSCNETCDSAITNASHEEYKRCKCKHRVNKKRSPNPVNYKKEKHKFKKIATPPNTASSADERNEFSSKNYGIPPEKLNIIKCDSCSNYKHRRQYTNFNVSDAYKKNPPLSNISSSASNKYVKDVNPNMAKKYTKTTLNPNIKAYVNKLLELNKEGIKAVEIINEECSSVPTPSSSIINDTLNINTKLSARAQISLEQIKNVLKEKIVNDYIIRGNKVNVSEFPKKVNSKKNMSFKIHHKEHKRRKQMHKVKSLNISKKIVPMKKNDCQNHAHPSYEQTSVPPLLKNEINNPISLVAKMPKCIRKNSSPPHKSDTSIKSQKSKTTLNTKRRCKFCTTTTPISTDSENISILTSEHDKLDHPPARVTTQASKNFDSDTNSMKVVEGKLQNMEKIADLTEKCTIRLSNLAKVLEEVRRNKSLAYSQITTSDSTSDSDLERNKQSSINKISTPPLTNFPEIQSTCNKLLPPTVTSDEEKENNVTNAETFIPFLTDIPKPITFKAPMPPVVSNPKILTNTENNSCNIECTFTKIRAKPPPALSRINLKNEQEHIIPHELSTVLEVDSPMSLKVKSQSRHNSNADISNSSSKSVEDVNAKGDNNSVQKIITLTPARESAHPDLVQSNINAPRKSKSLTTDSSDDSKLQMMDLKQFNEIMLKPFISIKEYAKNHNIETPEEASNIDDRLKDTLANDDLSSLHSEGSLPDVIAELLKRKIISEPFKFDTASNINSSTISSESTVSLALSNLKKERKKSSTLFQNKRNTAETSDTLSISSNPDLENAFQKLGMGWASSTLKKTKQQLALSSSSNTSSSSRTQLKNKNQINPSINSDSVSLLKNVTKSPKQNVEQQTSLSNSITVKEFLTKELAKRITFTNKSTRNITDQEFVSLYETKMPEEIKQLVNEEDQSANSVANCTNNRARTSTPVQMFKSMTYHSSSTSNTSNGLFSNADDLSSVKVTSNSIRNHSTSDKDDLTIPNYMLKMTKRQSDCSKSD
ncbi:unnamed protein product [Parnassius apollo]|uniref:(apollo) hypothetical protein n=1 Tax=Parnassius apollo TaxID=110799 RepID=A0A8S3WJF7_PARAO|nr:unnamed protein product [Parnassius apollo]